MHTRKDKIQENNSQPAINTASLKQTEPVFQLADNRPQTIAQRKLHETILNSPRVQQLKAVQQMAITYSQGKQLRFYRRAAGNFTSHASQRKENEDAGTSLQDHFAPIQKKKTIPAYLII